MDGCEQRKLRLMTYLVPGLPLEMYQALQYRLERVLGRGTLLVVESRWSCPPRGEPDPLTADLADVVFMCCPGYLRLAREGCTHMVLSPAAPVFQHPRNTDNRPVYYTDVITRKNYVISGVSDDVTGYHGNHEKDKDTILKTNNVKNNDIGAQVEKSNTPVTNSNGPVTNGNAPPSFSSLRGCKWGVNDCESLSGYYSTLLELRKRGLDTDFFSEFSFSGSHHRSIDKVLSGELDAAGVDSNTLRLWKDKNPDLASRLEVIESWGPFPVYPVVLNSRLSPGERDRITEALLGIGELGGRRDRDDVLGVGELVPGGRDDVLGVGELGPGGRDDVLGVGELGPGGRDDVLGVGGLGPGGRDDILGVGRLAPGGRDDVLGVGGLAPGGRDDVLGVGELAPGGRDDVLGVGGLAPGDRDDVLGVGGLGPGGRDGVLGVGPEHGETAQELRKFGLLGFTRVTEDFYMQQTDIVAVLNQTRPASKHGCS